MNVFDFAIKMEEESREHYEKLATAARTKELQTVFTLLADSEQEHLEHLMLLKAGTDPRQAQAVTLDRITDRVHDLVEGLAPEAILESEEDGYRHALKHEDISIGIYEKLAEQEPNKAAAELLRRLADEERQHLEVIENIYDFVESPRTYLAWGEFSNLREY